MRSGVFIYDGVEPIDLATFGVLSMARRVEPSISITTIAPRRGPVALSNGLEVAATHGLEDAPELDLLIVTGGPGWAAQCEAPATLAFLRERAHREVIASVCTGGMILAAAGLLDGLQATTKQEVIEGSEVPPLLLLPQRHPAVKAVSARLVDEGDFVTGGGVTLCIDVTLYLIERMLGAKVADETARILEYTAAREANKGRLPTIVRQPQ